MTSTQPAPPPEVIPDPEKTQPHTYTPEELDPEYPTHVGLPCIPPPAEDLP